MDTAEGVVGDAIEGGIVMEMESEGGCVEWAVVGYPFSNPPVVDEEPEREAAELQAEEEWPPFPIRGECEFWAPHRHLWSPPAGDDSHTDSCSQATPHIRRLHKFVGDCPAAKR